MIYRPPSSLLDDFVYAHITLEIKTSLVRDSLTTKSEEISWKIWVLPKHSSVSHHQDCHGTNDQDSTWHREVTKPLWEQESPLQWWESEKVFQRQIGPSHLAEYFCTTRISSAPQNCANSLSLQSHFGRRFYGYSFKRLRKPATFLFWHSQTFKL